MYNKIKFVISPNHDYVIKDSYSSMPAKQLFFNLSKYFRFSLVSMEKDDGHDKYLQDIFEFVIYSSENKNYVSNLKLTSCGFDV